MQVAKQIKVYIESTNFKNSKSLTNSVYKGFNQIGGPF